MEIGRAEGVLGDHPARREDHEVDVGHPRRVGGRGQHGEDRRVGMVEADRVDGIEARQVVLVGRVVAVPGHHVEWRVIEAGRPQLARELGDELELAGLVLVARHRAQEVARIGQAVGADRPQAGQLEGTAIVFADIAARRLGAASEPDLELDPARDDGDLARSHLQRAQFGAQRERALLRHDQQLAIGVVEEALAHVAVEGVDVHAATGLRRGIAIDGDRHQPSEEVAGGVGQRARVPAHLVGVGGRLARWRRIPLTWLEWTIGALRHRGANAVQPAAQVMAARGGERRAGQLFGIEAVGAALGCVLALRQGAG